MGGTPSPLRILDNRGILSMHIFALAKVCRLGHQTFSETHLSLIFFAGLDVRTHYLSGLDQPHILAIRLWAKVT